jgi:hypothetical protein
MALQALSSGWFASGDRGQDHGEFHHFNQLGFGCCFDKALQFSAGLFPACSHRRGKDLERKRRKEQPLRMLREFAVQGFALAKLPEWDWEIPAGKRWVKI